MNYQASNFLNSPKFLEIALSDAIDLIAHTNNQTRERTMIAYLMGVENVVSRVDKLVHLSAEHCANEANLGKLF